ncbi:MAG: DUF2442 domain-containing protein [Bacteroidales bacterium]|jgi:hypothetical protein|nr:DUF2442 domain-containing protein [Bacteroidales bacterium]
MKRTNYLELIQAVYLTDYTVKLIFNDGIERDIDFGGFLYKHPHPQWDKYRNLKKFQKFKIEGNNIVWGKNWDLIFPISDLYAGKNPL